MLIGESMIFIHTFSTFVHEMCIELNLPKSFFVWPQILYYSTIEIISIIVICYTPCINVNSFGMKFLYKKCGLNKIPNDRI